MKHFYICVLTMSMLFGCATQTHGTPSATRADSTNAEPTNTDEMYRTSARILFQHRAVSASLFGISKIDAGYNFSSHLEDYKPIAEKKFRQQMRAMAEKLAASHAAQGAAEENRRVMVNLLEYYAGTPQFPVGYIDTWMGHSAFLLNQINGPMVDIPNHLMNSHVINSVQDAQDYLARLKAFMPMAQSILAKVQSDERAGWVPPKALMLKTHAYLTAFTAGSAGQSPLVQKFSSRLQKCLSIPETEKSKLIEQAATIVETSVFPAYALLAQYMGGAIPRGRAEAGIWAQPDGDKFYAYSIRQLADSRMSAQDIHELGLKEVTRITAEMNLILSQEGYTTGSVGERIIALNSEPRFLYANSDVGREALLTALNGMLSDISAKMPAFFSQASPYDVVIRRIPIAVEDSSAGGYYTPPTLDGTEPGVYWINLKNTATNPKFALKTLTYHEAIPGHHWQIALNLAQKSLPLMRRIAPYNAYVEGWALYAEQLAAEMGMYKDDPFGNLGRLTAELFRAARLVVDTGLHHKHWTREHAIEYMVSTTGSVRTDAVSEIERYMAWPAQALGYKLGMMKILELRSLAKRQLGAAFDLRKFHDVILLGGAVPMVVLQYRVESWIEQSLHALR